MNKRTTTETTTIIQNQDSSLFAAKYLVLVVDRGMASEVNFFDSFEEAKRAFGEIAHDHGYKPSEINGSDKYDVSIWGWTEDRYEKVYGF